MAESQHSRSPASLAPPKVQQGLQLEVLEIGPLGLHSGRQSVTFGRWLLTEGYVFPASHHLFKKKKKSVDWRFLVRPSVWEQRLC